VTRLLLLTAALFLALAVWLYLLRLLPTRVEVWTAGGRDFRWPSKHPRADALMALDERDFRALLRGVGMRVEPDPFARPFGDA
jgi:hypothetical protein